ncbi:MAG: winged helix-turn-helix domain-containing protein, partial [Candidatus Norongarragalinales archaeon]
MISRLDISRVERLFGSRTRALILAKLLEESGESFYLRELSEQLDLAFSAVHREMENLERLGLVSEERRGRERFFGINPDNEIVEGL